MASLRRFVSRRGKPSRINSDNGSNFIGASSELKRLGEFLKENHTELTENIQNQGIDWHFIPAYSPHFGGLWEAGVKSMKYHLHRVAGNAIMTFEELCTLVTQIEGVLNSRPLSPISDDPQDLTPLTPSHFLIGRSMTSLPDEDLTDISSNRLTNFQRVQQSFQNIWKRWSKEFIAEVQQKTKWKKPHPPLKVGNLVIIKDDNQPPFKWKLGRILQVHPGDDNIIRVASILTSAGVIKRAYSKICPLPFPTDNEV